MPFSEGNPDSSGINAPEILLLGERLLEIKKRIKEKAISSGRDPSAIRLVCVSKKKSAAMIRNASKSGADIIGESYIREAIEKIRNLEALPLSWHFIGHLQSNKAKQAVRHFDLIHSVDSVKLAVELDKEAEKINKIQEILFQVNISGETTKSGAETGAVIDLIREIALLEHLSIQGLMTMPPFFDDPEGARPFFRELKQLRDRIEQEGIPQVHMNELSMGMTGDFEVAIEEGATLVRIGTAIFGERS